MSTVPTYDSKGGFTSGGKYYAADSKEAKNSKAIAGPSTTSKSSSSSSSKSSSSGSSNSSSNTVAKTVTGGSNPTGLTTAQVKEIQKQNGLAQDGIIGPLTQAVLNKSGGSTNTSASNSSGGSSGASDPIARTVTGGSNTNNLTTSQVKAIQAANGLTQDGIIGPLTQAVLNKTGSSAAATTSSSTGKNASSTPTTAIQTALGIKSDGIYGPQTTAAVKAFQTSVGLKADGIVGPLTQAALNKVLTGDTAKTDLLAEDKIKDIPKDPYQEMIDKNQEKLDQSAIDRQDALDNFNNAIDDIMNGSMPFNSSQQAQIEGLKSSYAQVIQAQEQQNINSQGVANIRGFQTGSAEYDPSFQAKVIGSIVSTGLQKVANLNSQLASSVGELTLAFQKDSLEMIKNKYDAFLDAEKLRDDQLEATIAAAQNAMAKAQEAKVQASKDNLITELYTRGITNPADILKQLQALGVTDISLKDIKDTIAMLQTATGTGGISAPTIKSIDGVDYQWNEQLGRWEKPTGVSPTGSGTTGGYKSEIASVGRQAVSGMLTIALAHPEIFGKTAALPLPDFVRSDAFRNYEAQIDYLKGNIIPAALSAMREASKTGGALGAVSDREGAWLASSLGALNMNQTPEQVVAQLREVDKHLAIWENAMMENASQSGTTITAPDGTEVIIVD